MNQLDHDRYLLGKQTAHAQSNVPRRATAHRTITLAWNAPRGAIVDSEGELHPALVAALGLQLVGYRDSAGICSYTKPEDSVHPDSVTITLAPARRSSVAADGTAMQEGADDSKRYEGVRPLVARECGMENRRGAGRSEYYAMRYPAFVQMAQREMDGQQRAATLAARNGGGWRK